jgi:hypothetical protein
VACIGEVADKSPVVWAPTSNKSRTFGSSTSLIAWHSANSRRLAFLTQILVSALGLKSKRMISRVGEWSLFIASNRVGSSEIYFLMGVRRETNYPISAPLVKSNILHKPCPSKPAHAFPARTLVLVIRCLGYHPTCPFQNTWGSPLEFIHDLQSLKRCKLQVSMLARIRSWIIIEDIV